MKVYEFKEDRIGSRSIVHKNGNDMYNLGDILSETIVVDTFEKTTTAVASGDTKDLSFNITKTGYTPIAIAGLRCNGTRSSFINVYHWFISDSTTAHVIFRNTHSSSALVNNDTKIKIYILYIKNSLT